MTLRKKLDNFIQLADPLFLDGEDSCFRIVRYYGPDSTRANRAIAEDHLLRLIEAYKELRAVSRE